MSFVYPELSKISASAFTSAGRKSTLLVIKTGTLIKTHGITTRTGANKYQGWDMQGEYLLISIDVEEIVLENLQPPFDATAKELWLYQKIIKTALAIRIQIRTPEILATYPHCLSPHELWTNRYSLYYQ
jgi:hypothetical protein